MRVDNSLGRLSAASTTGPQWGLSFTYDGWGNRLQQTVTKGSAPASSLAVDPATNRVTSWSYDSNGNATSIPGVGSIAYDYANRITTVQSDTYGYDPGNKRVWKNGKFVLWGAERNRLGTFELVFNQDYVGGGVYVWRLRWRLLSSDSYFISRIGQMADRIGSQIQHFPYGEEQSGSGSGDKFATYYRDDTGLDYASQRYYHSGAGRFTTVDPLGASGRSASPGSWNRYSYSKDDPVNRRDPEGTEDEAPWEAPCAPWCALLTNLKNSWDADRTQMLGRSWKAEGTTEDRMEWAAENLTVSFRGNLVAAMDRLSKDCRSLLSRTKLGNGKTVTEMLSFTASTVKAIQVDSASQNGLLMGGSYLGVIGTLYRESTETMTAARYYELKKENEGIRARGSFRVTILCS